MRQTLARAPPLRESLLMTNWNPEILNAHIAPGFGDFKSASIPDLTGKFDQAEHWVANYFGNSVLRASYAEPQRQLVLAYLRRAEHAFRTYQAARQKTLAFLAAPSATSYYLAVSDWEVFALNFSMACDIFNKGFSTKVFDKGDGSRGFRLYSIANNIKHPSSYLMRGGEGLEAIPLWLTNGGLMSYDGLGVAYQETAEIMTELATIAHNLQDPAQHLE